MPNAMTPWSELVQKDLAKVNVASLGKVGVLLGGKSGEREISLMSGKGVLEALLSKGVNAHAFDPAERSISNRLLDVKATQFTKDVNDLPNLVLSMARDGDVVITMGAGSISAVPGKLAGGAHAYFNDSME